MTSEIDISIDRTICRMMLVDFVRSAWHIIEPGTEYIHNWHIDLVCEYLMLVTQGKITRLIINIPPRYMKSLIVTVMWPVWSWLQKATDRFLTASYAQSLSSKHSIDRRTIMLSSWFLERFSDLFCFADDLNKVMEYKNNHEGYMLATSFGGSATGRGGNKIIIDDPMNPKEAHSDVERANVIREFDQTFTTRLDDKVNGAIVVVMQRLNEMDLTGHLLKKGGWTILSLPAIAEKDEKIVFPVSKRVVQRKEGDLLWPEREDETAVMNMKRALGSYNFAGQYQQRPSPKEGGTFKKKWFRYYGGTEPDAVQLPAEFDFMLQSWDTKFKKTTTGAYVCGQVWGVKGADCYLVSLFRDRSGLIGTIKAVDSMSKHWPKATVKLIEEAANGPAVIEVMQKKISGIIPVPPQGSKEARAEAVSPLVEAGNVWVPHPSICGWTDDFIDECAAFPNGAYKDQVDAMTQALMRIMGQSQTSATDIESEDDISSKYDI